MNHLPSPLLNRVLATTTDASLSTVVVRTPRYLKYYSTQLEALASQSIEPNVFYEPWMLFPALEHFAAKSRLLFLLIFMRRPGQPEIPAQMVGCFPLEVKRFYRHVPIRHLVSWRYPHCFLSTPLLHRNHAGAAVHAFASWFRRNSQCRLMEFTQAPADGEFSDYINREFISTDNVHYDNVYERSTVKIEGDFESYLENNTSANFQKKRLHKLKKLASLGCMDFRELGTSDSVDTWIDNFLELEKAGWKGEAGTALTLTTSDRTFFDTIMHEAFKRKQLSMYALHLDGKPIAMAIHLVSEHIAFGFKTAYDERYRAQAPGILLNVEMIRRLHQQNTVTMFDSCTDVNATAFNKLFVDRKPIRNLVVSNGNTIGNTIIRLMPAINRVKHPASLKT